VKERHEGDIDTLCSQKFSQHHSFHESLFEPNFPEIHLNTKLLFRATIQEEPQHEGGINKGTWSSRSQFGTQILY